MQYILSKYKEADRFIFTPSDDLKAVCNAPDDKCGIYIFYDASQNNKEIIYIGCSGHIKNDGSVNVRQSGCGGIKGRIVNGHQFDGRQRWLSLPVQMKKNKINELEIHWFVTCTNTLIHSPIFVESCLLQDFYETFGRLPRWNLKF
jgi:hypothetical protein